MTPEKLDELERLARAALPAVDAIKLSPDEWETFRGAREAFRDAANPMTVLELVAEIRRLSHRSNFFETVAKDHIAAPVLRNYVKYVGLELDDKSYVKYVEADNGC